MVTKAQKLILLAAAVLIVYWMLFPPLQSSDAIVTVNGKSIYSDIKWGLILSVAGIAAMGFLIAGMLGPRKKG
jgi:hypothetical protein